MEKIRDLFIDKEHYSQESADITISNPCSEGIYLYFWISLSLVCRAMVND